VETDTLNRLVTDAIWRAEELESRGIPSASLAWGEVSSLEEDLAKAHPVAEPEGRIARRGAVRAALKAGDYARAYALADRYLAEDAAPESLRTALREILEEYTQPIPGCYPYASKHHSLREVQGLADRLRASGAFGLAA
jgi:hypothetical protein